MLRRHTCLVIVLAALGCGAGDIPSPPAGFGHATATRDCGPADGPAVAIYLTSQPSDQPDPPPPYIRLYLWHGLDELAGRTWPLAGDGAQGSAQLCAASGECEVATDGAVRVGVVAADTSLTGSTQLTFPGAGRIEGGIRAHWVPRIVFCG
jgi:hypothetical protein